MASKGYGLEEWGLSYGPRAAMELAIMTRPDGTVPVRLESVPMNLIPVEENSLLGTEPERAVALADYDCRVATDYLARLIAIRADVDNAFIVANQDALDRLSAQ
jgi:hypothetical protein